MQQKDMISRLVTEFGYPEADARLIAEKLTQSQPEIQTALAAWWQQGKVPMMTVAGYDFQRLVEQHNMNAIGALLTLDWLLRDPEEAAASLRKGYDYVAGKG